jgi:hypothetical protein
MCCENLQKKLEESQVLVEAKKQKVQKTQLEIIVKVHVNFYTKDMKLVEK